MLARILVVSLFLALAGCAIQAPPPVEPAVEAKPYLYAPHERWSAYSLGR